MEAVDDVRHPFYLLGEVLRPLLLLLLVDFTLKGNHSVFDNHFDAATVHVSIPGQLHADLVVNAVVAGCTLRIQRTDDEYKRKQELYWSHGFTIFQKRAP
jgi:hypothetical protein